MMAAKISEVPIESKDIEPRKEGFLGMRKSATVIVESARKQ